MNLIFITPQLNKTTETFICYQLDLLFPGTIFSGGRIPTIINDRLIFNWDKLIPCFLKNRVKRFLFLREVNSIEPSVILIQYGTTAKTWIFRLNKKHKIVIYFHGYDATEKSGMNDSDFKRLGEYADLAVLPSQALKNRLVHSGYCGSNFLVLPYVAHNDFHDTRFVRKFEKGQILKMVFVGRLVEKKAPNILIDALAIVKQRIGALFHIRIIGDGPLMNSCREKIDELDLNSEVELLGAQGREVVLKSFLSSHLYIQHSLKGKDGDMEGSPVSIIEAQTNGLPVISTFHSGIPEVVEHEKTGLLSEEGSASKMAESILKIVHNPILIEKFSEAALLMSEEKLSPLIYGKTLKNSLNNLLC